MSNTNRVSGSKQAQALDWNGIAAEWVRAVRGKRSQAAFSRHLGYRSSVVHRWCPFAPQLTTHLR